MAGNDMDNNIMQTHVRLREYINDVFDARLETIRAVMDEREKNMRAAEAALRERLHEMNNLQAKLDRAERTYLSVDRFDRDHRLLTEHVNRMITETAQRFERDLRAVTDKLDPLLLWKAGLEGRHFRAQIISIVAVVVSALAVGVHFLKP